MRDVIAKLKALKYKEANPSEAWLKSNRELLLSQIKNTVAPDSHKKFALENFWQGMSLFMPKAMVYNVVRPAIALALVIALLSGGWVATVQASIDTVPGDLLYSAKRATEQTQVVVAQAVGATNAETKLHVEFAKRRAVETKKLVSTSDPQNIQRATQTVNDLKTEMNTVSNNLDALKTLDKSSSAQDAKDITQNAEQIKQVLTEVKADLLVSQPATSSTPADSLTANISQAKDIAKDTAVKAVEVMVTKHLQGDTSVSKDDIKQTISDQIQSNVKDANVSSQNVEEVKKAVDSVQSEVKDLPANDTSTKALSSQVNEAVKQTQTASDMAKGISSSTAEISNRAQQMLSSDNLQQAVDLVRQASDANQLAEKALDNTLKTVQTVLPTTVVVKGTNSAAVPATSSVNIVITATSTIVPTTTGTSTPTTSQPTVIIIVTSTVK